MKKLDNTDWVPLTKYIENLLRSGKRSKDPEFKLLFGIYGEKKIREMAEYSLKKWREAKKEREGK